MMHMDASRRTTRSGARRSVDVRANRTLGILLVLGIVFTACDDPRETGEPAEARGTDPARTEADRAGPPEETRLPAVAITIDDLPWVGPLPPGLNRLEGTVRILAALARHDAPAAGFTNCGRVPPGAPVLRRWLEAGHLLGNHTSHHLDLNNAEPAEWAAGARDCDRFLRELTGEPYLYFRYPYLHRGHTLERYSLGRETLEELESPIAHVSIDTGDWLLDDSYVDALLAGDSARAEEIAGVYVDHVLRAAEHYRQIAVERVDRDVAHILLLHANALLADHLDTLLARLEETGFRFVRLEEALEDPVYALPDDYIGPDGLSWLYRIPPATPEAAAWDDAEAERLRELLR